MRGYIITRTVPNVMQAYGCSAETAQRYTDLRDEGYSMEQARLMAGLGDPPDDERTTIAQRLDDLMRRMREEHHEATYADLLAVKGTQ